MAKRKLREKPRTAKADETNPWKRVNSEKIYDNAWISLREDKVIRPDGELGLYGVVSFKNTAVGVLALNENAKGETQVVLVGQYRYALKRYSWEIPEGGCPRGEQPLAAAKRELEEETGYRAKKWKHAFEMDLSNSVTDERAVIYVATGLTMAEAKPEGTEVLKVKTVPLTKALRMVLRGEITDGISVAALLYAGHR